MRKRISWGRAGLSGLACLTLALSGCTFWPKEESVLKPPLVVPQKEMYNLHEVKRGTVTRQVKGTGVFQSSDVVSQHFYSAGKVTAVPAKPGDRVRQGDPLIELEIGFGDIAVKERVRDLAKARRNLNLAKESRDEELIPIRILEVDIAERLLNDAQSQLDGKTMRAEIDGIIVAMEEVKIGDTVEPAKPYITIADPQRIELTYTSSGSEQVQEVRAGMRADIVYRDRQLQGTVVQSPANAPPAGQKPQNDGYANTIYLRLDDAGIRPELNDSAEIQIVLQKKENVIVIPRFALTSVLGRTYVKVLEGERIREADVETGLESAAEIEIVKGLEEGQQIIIQ